MTGPSREALIRAMVTGAGGAELALPKEPEPERTGLLTGMDGSDPGDDVAALVEAMTREP